MTVVNFGFQNQPFLNPRVLRTLSWSPETCIMAYVLLALACPVIISASADGDAFNFLVMGDWGGQGSHPYTTAEEIATAVLFVEP